MSEVESAAPLCKNCKYLVGIRSDLNSVNNWRCAHPKNVFVSKPSLATGLSKKSYLVDLVEAIREREEICGPAGKWFEQYEYPADLYQKVGVESKSSTPTLDRLKRIKINISDL